MGPRNKCGDDNLWGSFLKLALMGFIPATHGAECPLLERAEQWVPLTSAGMTGVCSCLIGQRCSGFGGKSLLRRIFYGFLDFFKGADFDLADAFARDVEFL